MNPSEPPRQLQRLSDTRWACRAIACRNIRDRLPAVRELLAQVAADTDSDRAVEARGLLAQLDFEFVLLLGLFSELLTTTNTLSLQLQARDADFAAALDLLQTLTDDLQQRRDDDKAQIDSLFAKSQTQCGESNIEIDIEPPAKRARRLPTHLANFVVTETVGQTTDITVDRKDTFRTEVYLPVIDCLLSELKRRFSVESCAVMRGIQGLNPRSKTFLDLEVLKSMATKYNVSTEDLTHEVYQAKRLLSRKAQEGITVDSLQQLVEFMEPYKDAFYALFQLIKIAIILPVSTASCERSFSIMRQIKTYLRNSMGDERLSNLAVLSIESKRAKALDLDSVVDEFDCRHENRRIALH